VSLSKPLRTVGLLGGGVIGGGWAARFILNGIDVKIYDVDPQAERKIGEVMANARRAYAKLTLAPLPKEGKITFVATPEEAVTDVDFVQESAPERVELKQELLARASRAAKPETVFGSSTSGILPTQLQRDMVNPDRLVVATLSTLSIYCLWSKSVGATRRQQKQKNALARSTTQSVCDR